VGPELSQPTDLAREGELRSVARALHRLDEVHRRLRNTIAASQALSGSELSALFVLSDTGGMHRADLANELGISRGAVSGLLDQLQDAGLTHAALSPTSGGRERHVLTPAGDRVMTTVRASYLRALRTTDSSLRVPGVVAYLDMLSERIERHQE